MFEQIPLQRPLSPLLDSLESPADLRLLPEKQLLPLLARELRVSFALHRGADRWPLRRRPLAWWS